MLRMTTWPGKTGRDHASCTWEGRAYQALARSATTTLARQLVAAGCPDQPWEATTPAGTRSLHGTSLHAWAKLSVSERERGFRIEPFTEHPNAGARDEARTADGDPVECAGQGGQPCRVPGGR